MLKNPQRMPVDRRTAIRQFVFASAGMVIIPSCMNRENNPGISLKNISLSKVEESFLEELAETIIPRTQTPGAKDISAHRFVLKMVDDCSAKRDQEIFMSGLKAFSKEAERIGGKHFSKLDAAGKIKVVQEIEASSESDETMRRFYKTFRKLTIQAYSSSEFFLTSIRVYEIIPGRFHGCVPVSVV
jgi:hypothetical protein